MINSYLTITELQQKQEVDPSKCLAFFLTHEIQRQTFSLFHPHVSHPSFTQLQSDSKMGLRQCSVSFSPLLLRLAYFDVEIWGRGERGKGGNAVDF